MGRQGADVIGAGSGVPGDSRTRTVRDAGAEFEPSPWLELALQFELREMIPRTADRWNGPTSRAVKVGQEIGSGVFQLGTRPVQRTARGWSRGGLSWSNIGHQGSRLNLDPAQQRWFRQFVALHRAAETITVGQDPNWVFLDDFASPALWALLLQADTLGIALVGTGPRPTVQLREAAELSLDAAATLDGGIRLVPRVTVGDDLAPFRSVRAIADHGIYGADPDAMPGGHAVVWLAPVAAALTAAERGILARGSGSGAGSGAAAAHPAPLTIPAIDRDAFLAEGVPELRTRFRLTSADGSVVIPDPPPARIVLTAAWRNGHRLSLNWVVEGDPDSTAPVFSELIPRALRGADLLPEAWADAALPPATELRGVDAAAFLGGVLPVLERTPGIEVRRTGRAPEYRELTSPPQLEITVVPSEQEDWFDLGVLVTVDGRSVPFAPLFRALAQGRKKLLLVDNSYLSLTHPALAPLAEMIAEAQDLDEWETGPRISRHQAAHWAEFEDLAEQSEAAAEWRMLVREVRAVQAETPTAVPVPRGMTAELRPYQRDGFHWLAFLWRTRLGGILADDMGLGKTLQCLTLIEHARELGERRPFLVVAPTSVMSNWAAEAARFAPGLRVRVRTATEASGRKDSPPAGSIADDLAAADLVVTSYALFRLDFASYRAVAADPARGIAGLILDEAQFVKNARARGNELAEDLPVSWKLAVTGTPIENSLRELHALCRIVAPGLFPSARRFEEEYVRAIERPALGISVGQGAGSGPESQAGLRTERTERLRQRVRPFLLRRTKALVASELPEKHEQVLEVELDPEHRELYDRFMQRERQKLYGLIPELDRNRFTVFRSLTLLRMLALDASLIDGQYAALPSAKLGALVEHAAELAQEGRRTLVFSQFTSFLSLAKERLEAEGIRTVTLDGSTRQRDAVIDRFRSGEADVFLISLKAGGVGLNLTEADTVVLLDPWWNPASEAQAIDRTHRIGQERPVHVIRMIALGTIEEKVLALQQRKRALFDAVIDDEELFSQTLTASELRDLLDAPEPPRVDGTSAGPRPVRSSVD
ncbi:probable helicase [Leucobacter sp. 7(1)]|nr:probable helicase [Leucobacter sp. 7(1)]